MTLIEEAPETRNARQKIIEICQSRYYCKIDEEYAHDDITNNMGEPIFPPYQSDIIVWIAHSIELDPQTPKKGKSKGHGTKKQITKDKWKDKNIRNQKNIPTARVIPTDVKKLPIELIMQDIEWQWSQSKK